MMLWPTFQLLLSKCLGASKSLMFNESLLTLI